MARPKKIVDSPVNAPAKEVSKEGATLVIDVESFVSIRNSVVTGLTSIQNAIRDISSAYIKHTDAVLGAHGAGLDVETALARLGGSPLFGRGLGGLRAASPARSPAASEKKKKKRVQDPDHPKRPLTPYFLYMQTARPIIAEDLGPETPKGAVSTEGVRRWNAMAAHDKKLWNDAYADNLKLYGARVHAFKAGNIAAKDLSDEEALAYAEAHNIGNAIEHTADGQLAAEALLDAPADIDEDILPPAPIEAMPKTPKGKPTRKGKQSLADSEPIAPPSSSAIIPPGSAKAIGTPATAEPGTGGKRKRTKKVADEPLASIEKEDAAQPAEKKQRKKKGAA